MIGSNWRIGILLNASGNALSTMTRLSSTAKMANFQFQRTQGLLNKNQVAAARYAEQMRQVQMRSAMLGATVAGSVATMGAAFITSGVEGAAQFERAMTGVQIATSATTRQFMAPKGLALQVSGVTAQSAVTIAREMQRPSEVEFKDPAQLQKLFPMMSKYADVRWIASGGQSNPVETVGQIAMFAHLFQRISRLRWRACSTACQTPVHHARRPLSDRYPSPVLRAAGYRSRRR